MSFPCENSRRKDEVPITTSTPSTPIIMGYYDEKTPTLKICSPVSTAILASSIWHRICVRILDLKPSLHIASQSRRDCSDAAGEVSSMYSTPNASRALAIAILVFVSKKAFANCSPSNRCASCSEAVDMISERVSIKIDYDRRNTMQA